MKSRLLIEYMRTGWIAPLKEGDSKELVEAKLGAPGDWKGRVGGFGWTGPLLSDFHDSWAWHYGALCVTFPDPTELTVFGISLDLGFRDSSAPIRFPAPFEELPQSPFSLQELIDLLDEHGVRHQRHRTGFWVSEGNIAIATSTGEYSPEERVSFLFPHDYRQADGSSRSGVRLRLIEKFTEILRHPGLPVADRIKCEECLRVLELRKGMDND